ncbi:hypothetical protein [Streptomyces roseolilacinus]|uniref:DUF4352 domain-containing protein n=1 Tax=Streptomyces roseolilacinus TaxID=66904 RepID=A0A918EM38_9ACTN|nr:hypothetical protein [Streptomyces roseolilacinus]GGQ27089.1 hypothetical protein GCM10010249_52270 [Streptomyces roseolilacinus]
MRTRTTAALAVFLLTTLTACGTEPTPDKPASAPQPSTGEMTEQAPSPSTSTPQSPLPLGEAWKWEGLAIDGVTRTKGSTVALSYTQPVVGFRPPGKELGVSGKAVWARIEVKVCNEEGGNIHVTQSAWSLAYEDGAQAEVTGLHGGDFPKPEFPMNEKLVKPGKCVRGGIMFPTEPDQRPERIVYHPDSIDEPIEWAVPTK